MDVFARWDELMELPEATLPLDEAALLISAGANPALDVAAQLGRLDEIAGRARVAETDALCRLLFSDMGLRGDRENYDDPVNSYLDRVLDRGLGIPISLSVLLMEVGRRCGVRLEAVGMPGHFLVRDLGQPGTFIDAFNGGRRLDMEGCRQLLQSVTGAAGTLSPEMLAGIGPRATLARMLANLDRSFDRRGDRGSLIWVSDLRRRIPDAPLADRAQLAGRLASLGRFDSGAAVLEEAATQTTAERVRDRLLADARTMRARLN